MTYGAAPTQADAWLPLLSAYEPAKYPVVETIYQQFDARRAFQLWSEPSDQRLWAFTESISLIQSDLQDFSGVTLENDALLRVCLPSDTWQVPITCSWPTAGVTVDSIYPDWMSWLRSVGTWWARPAETARAAVELPDWLGRAWDNLRGLWADPSVEVADEGHQLHPVYLVRRVDAAYVQLRVKMLRRYLVNAARLYFAFATALAFVAHVRDRAFTIVAIIHTFMTHRHSRESAHGLLSHCDSNIRNRRVATI